MIKHVLRTLIAVIFISNVLVYAYAGNMNTAVEEKTTSLYDANYKPEFIQEIRLDAAQVILANGAVFKHAGFGATIGFKGKRLNYTGKDNTGLIGPFLIDKNGNLFVEYVKFEYAKSNDPYKPDWKLVDSKIVRAQEINWDFKGLKEEFADTSCDRCR